MSLATFIDVETKRKLFECAINRHTVKRKNYTRKKSGEWTDIELHQLGILGEYAAASVLNVDIDWSIQEFGDGGHDLDLDGYTVCVKFSHRINGHLIVEGRASDTPEELHDCRSDIMILTHYLCEPRDNKCKCRCTLLNPTKPSIILVAGWTSREHFMRDMIKTDWGMGTRYYVPQSKLYHMSTLFRQLEPA